MHTYYNKRAQTTLLSSLWLTGKESLELYMYQFVVSNKLYNQLQGSPFIDMCCNAAILKVSIVLLL